MAEKKELQQGNIKKIIELLGGEEVKNAVASVKNAVNGSKSLKTKLEEKISAFKDAIKQKELDAKKAEEERIAKENAIKLEKEMEAKKAEEAKAAEKPQPKPADKAVEKPAEKPVEKPVEVARKKPQEYTANDRPQFNNNRQDRPNRDNRERSGENRPNNNRSENKQNDRRATQPSKFNDKPKVFAAPQEIPQFNTKSNNYQQKKKNNNDKSFEDKRTVNKRALIKNNISIDDFDEDKSGYRKLRVKKNKKEEKSKFT